jgi:hypothetical protein
VDVDVDVDVAVACGCAPAFRKKKEERDEYTLLAEELNKRSSRDRDSDNPWAILCSI